MKKSSRPDTEPIRSVRPAASVAITHAPPLSSLLSLAAVRRALAEKSAPWLIILTALLLTSSALTLGMTGDDYLHQQMAQEDPGVEGIHHAVFTFFTFASGDPEQVLGLKNEGMVPWWADPALRFAMFRPLTSLTHALDHALWPDQPLLMHLHNMAWFALLLCAVGAVHRRFSDSAWVAGLALLLYAVDDARATPVGWIANRNALIATLPPLLGLLAHDRWRKSGSQRAALLAPLLFALGLGGGEAGVQVGAYYLAYALFLDAGSWRRRLLSLAPYGAVVIVWRVAYVLGEYGVRGTGLYIDAASDPLTFARLLATRLPVLLLAQFGLPWADLWDLLPVVAPSLQNGMLVFALVVMVLTVLLLRPLFVRDPLVRFWSVGTLLATLPACSAIPNDRLLTATGVGGSMLIARFIAAVLEGSYPRESRPVRAAAITAIAVHALFSPFILPFRVKAVDGFELLARRADRSIASTPDVAEREVIVINPPVDPLVMFFAASREAQGLPRPKHLRWLAVGVSELVLTRVDEQTLNLRPTLGFLSNSSQWVLRDPHKPSYVGETVALRDATFVVKSLTPDRRPLDVQVRFHERLESASFEWLQWGTHEYVPFRPPALGQSVTIPAVDMKAALLGLGIMDS